jgi:hypothetical protein
VFSPDGTEAIALFSGEEEAKMFCHLRGGEGAGSTVRRTTAGGVLSLLYCPWTAKRVALDPFPEVLGRGDPLSPTLGRARFARRFAGVGREPVAPCAPRGQGRSRIWVSEKGP